MTNLQNLHTKYDQSPWLDNLSRDLVKSGRLQTYINNGVRGLTSNPTILEKAITSNDSYDDQIIKLSNEGLNAEQIYWKIVIDDIRDAANLLKPIWEESNGEDGYVSLEVSPTLTDDTQGTIDQAKKLWNEVNVPNLFIKVPATKAGIPAIKELCDSGININVTLLFGLDRYQEIVKTHLETHTENSPNSVRSVASLFVSRFDTEVDRRLTAINTSQSLALRGKAAVAQARVAYGIFMDNFGSFADTNSHSAKIQRLLWASTSTKNPEYDDLLYVKNLIAPLTVNTLPEDTINKIMDHLPSDLTPISAADVEQAKQTLSDITSVGVDLSDVAAVLETEGVKKFQDSFSSLLSSIETKISRL